MRKTIGLWRTVLLSIDFIYGMEGLLPHMKLALRPEVGNEESGLPCRMPGLGARRTPISRCFSGCCCISRSPVTRPAQVQKKRGRWVGVRDGGGRQQGELLGTARVISALTRQEHHDFPCDFACDFTHDCTCEFTRHLRPPARGSRRWG